MPTVIYLCPTSKRLQCPWEGDADSILPHFKQQHSHLVHNDPTIDIDLTITQENHLIAMEDSLYLLQTEIPATNGELLLRLRYLGNEDPASKQYDVRIGRQGDEDKQEVVAMPDGWRVDLEGVNRANGITCQVFVRTNQMARLLARKQSTKLKINNSFVERNACDEVERSFLDDLSLVENRIAKLRSEQQDNKLSEVQENHGNEEEMLRKSLAEPESPNGSHGNEDENALRCSTCDLDMLPPIYLCTSGHSVCSGCKSVVCKLCQSTITEHRNVELENVSRTQRHRCRYHGDGCNEHLYYNELRSHEAECTFCR